MEQEHKQPSTEAISFFKEAGFVMADLYFRWADEKKYEDINDYKIPLNTIATNTNVSITEMCKRPFGCIIKVPDNREYFVYIKAKKYEMQRIK